jgi:hypothetical protein
VVLRPISAEAAEQHDLAPTPDPAAAASTDVGQQHSEVEDVRLYADIPAVQGQLQEALAAAGLQGHVDLLQVVITEGETGRLLGCQEVPLGLVVGGGAM